jgi:phosphopantetheinyl transferase (holo-ACP synthase)
MLAEIWALKEAVFKAFGPVVDFKRDIKVNFPIERTEATISCRGENRKWLVQEVSCVTLAMGPF